MKFGIAMPCVDCIDNIPAVYRGKIKILLIGDHQYLCLDCCKSLFEATSSEADIVQRGGFAYSEKSVGISQAGTFFYE